MFHWILIFGAISLEGDRVQSGTLGPYATEKECHDDYQYAIDNWTKIAMEQSIGHACISTNPDIAPKVKILMKRVEEKDRA